MLKLEECLFHGTNKEYHDKRLLEHGKYVHSNWSGINLSEEYLNSLCVYAVDRAKQYGGTPLLLVISKAKVSPRIKIEKEVLIVDYLLPNEYLNFLRPNPSNLELIDNLDLAYFERFLRESKFN